MRIRKYAQLLASNNNDDVAPQDQRKEQATGDKKRKKKKAVNDIDAIENSLKEAKPYGNVVKVSGKGTRERNHFASFDYNGIRYNIEDSVKLWVETENQNPYVAIIKDITQKIRDGSMMVKVQWFYRPEDTSKTDGGMWESTEKRELYYSFHKDVTPVESIMEKCVVQFIPLGKQILCQEQDPDFIVHKVYDTRQKELFNLTDDVYPKNNRKEIDRLIQKTMSQVEELPNIDRQDQLKKKRISAKKRPNA